MVDERKVGLMTKLSIYEKHEKSRSLVLSRYFKSDYVRYNVLKTWIATTIAYWTVVGAYVMMSFDDILAELNNIDYFDVMYKFLGYYVVCCAVLFLFSSLVYKYRYSKAKPGLIKYNSMLKDLIELQGGPMRRGKMVANSDIKVEVPEQTMDTIVTPKQNPKNRVSRSEIVKRRLEEEEKIKEQQIIENVKKRNARIAARNEEELRRQQEILQEKQRIQQHRQQLEKEQLERIKNERMNSNRENHTYYQNQPTDGKENR